VESIYQENIHGGTPEIQQVKLTNHDLIMARKKKTKRTVEAEVQEAVKVWAEAK